MPVAPGFFRNILQQLVPVPGSGGYTQHAGHICETDHIANIGGGIDNGEFCARAFF